MNKERFRWCMSGIDQDSLTDWELEFLESCEEQLEYKEELSERQSEICERIYKERQP